MDTLDPPITKSNWEKAASFVREIGPFSPLFTNAIARIHSIKRLNFGKNPGRIRNFAVDAVIPLVERSRSLRVLFLNAVPVLKGARVENPSLLSPHELLSQFTADEICGLIATTYLASMARQNCPPEAWQEMLPDTLHHIEIGFMFGKCAHKIGTGIPIFAAALRYLSCLLFSNPNLDKFLEYRDCVKRRGALFDMAEEERRWGCNHLQIASLLLQKLGYGRQAGQGFAMKLEGEAQRSSSSDAAMMGQDEWQMALIWIERVQTKDDWLHDITYAGQEIGVRESLVELKRTITAMPQKCEAFAWLVSPDKRRKQEEVT